MTGKKSLTGTYEKYNIGYGPHVCGLPRKVCLQETQESPSILLRESESPPQKKKSVIFMTQKFIWEKYVPMLTVLPQ